MAGKLILIVGPSGVGKGSIISRLKKKYGNFVFPISSTTRKPRPKENHGEVYEFISVDEFKKGIEDGKFLEYALVHSDNFYGTQKEPILKALKEGKTVIREIDIQGFKSILKYIPQENLVSIFLYVKNWETLYRRIMRRHQESKEELEQRRISFEKEMEQMDLCDYQVESREGDIESVFEDIENIVNREVSR